MATTDTVADVKPERKKAGRKTQFQPEYLERAYRCALLGMTNVQMAAAWGFKELTVERWRKKIPAFNDAIKRGGALADGEVVESLFNQAKGYTYKEDVIVKRKVTTYNERGVRSGESEVVEVLTVERRKLPSDTACIFWLKSRQRDQFAERREITGASGGPIEIIDPGTSEEELRQKLDDKLAGISERMNKPPAIALVG